MEYYTSSACTPCKKFLPIVQTALGMHNIPLEIVSIDEPEGAMKAMQLGVMSVPQAFAYHDGKVIDRFGVITTRQLVSKIESYLK